MSESTVCARQPVALRLVKLLSLLLVLCLGGYLLFVNLGEMHIVDYDEARHGVNAYEMIRNDDYLVHTYAGEPDYWNLKTPLSFWSIALSYKLFGYNAFALRFFAALSTLLSMTALTCWAWRRHGYLPALMAALVFVCSAGIYANHFARFGDADSQYQLFFTLAMLCMLMSRRDFRWFYGSAVGFVFAFMLKAAHAVVIPVVCFAYLLCTGRLRELNVKRVLALLAVGLVPILVWAAARYSRDGLTFFQNMLFVDVVGRVGSASTEEVGALGGGMLGTLWYFVGVTLPIITPIFVVLAILVLGAVACVARRAKLSCECADTLIGAFLWLAIPIAVYTLVGTRYPWYIYSAYAALPALVAGMTRAVLDAGTKRLWVGLCACAAAVALCVSIWSMVDWLSHLEGKQTYQDLLAESLDRDMDSGTHAYIQYGEVEMDKSETVWMPGTMLAAYFAGDVVCMDGGVEAFEQDEEAAMLVITKTEDSLSVIDELMGYCIPRAENYYVMILEK